jgi:hypothetical protein
MRDRCAAPSDTQIAAGERTEWKEGVSEQPLEDIEHGGWESAKESSLPMSLWVNLLLPASREPRQ